MRVMLAMSGGVDSSVAAAMLLDDGHEVVGVTMRLWGGESDTGCCSVADVDDARRVAQQLGIDHVVFNFTEEFVDKVVDPYVDAHRRGVTPNPCIECNRHIKFERLAERAELLGFDALATGHHARVEQCADGRVRLRRGVDRVKDQSYVVHMLSATDLARTIFPVGSSTKEEVRRRAEGLGLRTASKPDSQDVCFITSTGGRETFLGDRIPFRPAEVVDLDGRELGRVEAVELVTVGQRRGLGLPGGGPKRYVVDVDPVGGRVVVGGPADVLEQSIVVEAPTWIDGAPPAGSEVLVQCSAHGEPRRARVVRRAADPTEHVESRIELQWCRPEARVAPGQSIVLYDLDDEYVYGGGLAAGR